MTDEADHIDPGICWQCGAPADRASEYVAHLNSRPRQHPDAYGARVKRGRWQDSAWVHVPRCAACRDRNWLSLGMCILAFFAGAVVGGSAFPSNGWTIAVGGFGCMIAAAIAVRFHERWRGIRNLADYPPLRRLLANGWSTPD